MFRAGSFLVALSFSSIALAQTSAQVVRVWDVTWRSVETRDGTAARVPVLRWAETEPPKTGQRYTPPPNLVEVVRLEERLRVAQRAKDGATIQQILSDQFFETDVNSVGRDKTAAMQFLALPEMLSFTTDNMTARATDNAVVLIGEETSGPTDRRRFTHVYVREPAGEWKLLSSTTVANPR